MVSVRQLAAAEEGGDLGGSEVVVVLEPADGAVDTLLEVGVGFETGGGGECAFSARRAWDC